MTDDLNQREQAVSQSESRRNSNFFFFFSFFSQWQYFHLVVMNMNFCKHFWTCKLNFILPAAVITKLTWMSSYTIQAKHSTNVWMDSERLKNVERLVLSDYLAHLPLLRKYFELNFTLEDFVTATTLKFYLALTLV